MWIQRSLGAVILTASLGIGNLANAAENLAEGQVEENSIHVVIETTEGDVRVALYPGRAPLSVTQFLSHVDAGNYQGASFYRVTRESDGAAIDVVQGGLLAEAMRDGMEAYAAGYSPMAPVAHETTDLTGIINKRGTLALARLDPGSADSEFFFNLRDNPELNTGFTEGGRDGHGYAAFGRVEKGMQVLEAIQRMPSDAPTAMEMVRGQVLEQPVLIQRIYRVSAAKR